LPFSLADMRLLAVVPEPVAILARYQETSRSHAARDRKRDGRTLPATTPFE
jgi:hypothetical protein